MELNQKKIRISLNTFEPKVLKKVEDGKINSYIYSIERDENGIEVNRTEPILVSTIYYYDNSLFGDIQRLTVAINTLKKTCINELTSFFKKYLKIG